MIDTHAHIYLPEFDADRESMLMRAKGAGVSKIYMPNIDEDSIASMLALHAAHPDFCFPLMGLHPCSVKEDFQKQLLLIENYLNNKQYKFYGVGECGLDYFWDTSLIAQQKEAFEFQIALAKKCKLPIIIHSRDATDDCIALIAKHKDADLRGIFHCFSGNAEQLQQVVELGFHAGIGGVVTFKNGGLDKTLNATHLSSLVIETDAPYLAPLPFRGKRNEPGYLSYITKRLGEVLQLTEQEVIAATTSNAVALFRQ